VPRKVILFRHILWYALRKIGGVNAWTIARIGDSLDNILKKSLFDPDLNRNFFLEGDEDNLVEKLIELLDDPAKCDVMGENPRQVIDSEINSHTVIAGFRFALRSRARRQPEE
jgi:hypothetical protein